MHGSVVKYFVAQYVKVVLMLCDVKGFFIISVRQTWCLSPEVITLLLVNPFPLVSEMNSIPHHLWSFG